MTIFYILRDKQAIPCSNLEKAIQRSDDQQIGVAKVKNRLISTNFLYSDANDKGYGKPLLFETSVLYDDGSSCVLARYNAYEEALKGHNEIVIEYEDLATKEKKIIVAKPKVNKRQQRVPRRHFNKHAKEFLS